MVGLAAAKVLVVVAVVRVASGESSSADDDDGAAAKLCVAVVAAGVAGVLECSEACAHAAFMACVADGARVSLGQLL